jgi:signal peptidase I
LGLKSYSLLKPRAERSSSETLIKRNASDTDRNGVWIDDAKILPELISDLLTDGRKVRFCAPGDSMYPTILNGDEITVESIKPEAINVGDIILYRNKNSVIAHRVVRTENKSESHFQSLVLTPQTHFIFRGDAAVVFDDPVSAEQILGKVICVEREGRRVNPYTRKAIIRYKARRLAARVKRSVFFKRN